jgi:cysteinyl-tRNA synthetase
VCNLTDIDDKIIKRMTRDNVTLQQLTNRYADLFFEDLRSLNVLPARAYPRATEHVPEIVEMVQQLMDKVSDR